MKFVIATRNKHKLQELQRILTPLGIEAITADLSEVEETGTTFAENACLKAKAACEETGLPAVADDSGLEVDALDGRPGVYSARYAEKTLPTPSASKNCWVSLQRCPPKSVQHGSSVLSAVCFRMGISCAPRVNAPVLSRLLPPEKTVLAMTRCSSAAKKPLPR